MAGRFFLRFCLLFCCGTCHRRDTAGKENAPKSIRRRSGKEVLKKAVEMARHDSHQGRGKLPPCMPQSECGAGHTGYRIFLVPSPGGSQDTGGAFRSRVQRSGVRGCSHEQRSKTYLGGVKPRTAHIYKSDIRLHILPALGAVRLEALNAPMIQAFYNAMGEPSEQNPKGLSAKTVKNVHDVLHKALQQAVLIGYLRYNPADACIPPRIKRKKIKPFDDAQITAFLSAIQGNRYETLFILTLFTGMREGEVLGLTWDYIDFHTGIISVEKQMQLHQDKGSKGYELVSPKNGRSRTIAAAQTVLARLQQRRWQMQQKLLLGSDWQNPEGLVFTNEFGTHLTKPTVYREYKRIVAAIGCPDARFHDLRHSYAVAAIRAGDDIKTVQGNLGHATAAFTLDVYGHVTDQMKRESADRMERFIRTVSAD